jgi:hypothetical protein
VVPIMNVSPLDFKRIEDEEEDENEDEILASKGSSGSLRRLEPNHQAKTTTPDPAAAHRVDDKQR